MQKLTVTILDGQLGLVNAVGDQVVTHLGVCSKGTPNTVYGIGDSQTASNTLGVGTLVENVADTVGVAGACYAVPVTPSTTGTAGSTTHTGTGTATVVGAGMPLYQILAKITTAGALGTMRVAFSVNGGAYGTPVLSTVSTFSTLVAGTLTTLTFADQTYTLNDVWTITTAGVITVSGAGTAGWVTQASSPADVYDVLVVIQDAGALGAATFKYSLDGGNSYSSKITVPGGGTYVIPGAGVMLTFSGTFVAADTYEFTTTTAGFGTTDVGAALTALANGPQQWFGFHVAGQGASAAAAASMAATVSSALTAMEVAYRYVMGIVECPQTEGDSTIEAAFASFASSRVMVTCTDVLHESSLTRGRTLRRNIGLAIATRLADTQPSEDPGHVGGGALTNVTHIYRDEAATPGLGLNRFCVGTTVPTKVGYFCDAGNMMAQVGSDFSNVGNRRVMDIACSTSIAVLIDYCNGDVQANDDGTIFDPEATKIEDSLKGALGNRLLRKSPPQASAVDAVVNRTNNVISTQNLQVTVKVRPKALLRTISLTIGYEL